MFSVSIIGMFAYKEVMANDTNYLVIFDGNISDIVGKRGRILGVIIFMSNISFKNVSYVFVKIVQLGATI